MVQPAPPDPPRRPEALVDRDRDLAALGRMLEVTARGEGAMALVEGPAGIGKSALLGALRQEAAERGVRVLAARAGELEQEFPFGVIRQLFEGLVADPAERERRLAGAAAPAAAVFQAPGAVSTEEAGSFATLHGLYWLVADVAADGPLLLAVDDLHWCDTASLRFLSYLARRLEGLPVLLAAGLRSGEPGTDPRIVAELAHDPAIEVVALTPLAAEATAALVRDRLGEGADPAFCRACHDASAGNPLLLRQLLRALESDRIAPTAQEADTVLEIGPRAVSRTVLLRLGRLAPEAISLARAVSILGDGAELDVAARFAGLDRRTAAAATGPLARAEILRPDLPLEFVHPLVREAVYLEQPAGERAAGHAAAADVLRDAGADPERIATQLLPARPRGEAWVVTALHDAGLDALTRGAPESAAAYLRRALAEPPEEDRRPRLLYDLGRAEARSDGPSAIEHLTAALEGLREPLLRADAACTLPRLLTLTGRAADAAALCRRLLEETTGDDPASADLRRSLVAFERMAGQFTGRPSSELTPVDGLLDTRAGVGAKRLLAITAFERSFGDSRADDVVPLALDALDDGTLLPHDDTFLTVAAVRVLIESDHPQVMPLWDAALADAHRSGSLAAAIGVFLWRASALLRQGDLAGAAASLDLAEARRVEWGAAAAGRPYQTAFRTEILVGTGDLAGARAVLEGLETPASPGSDGARLVDGARIRLLLAEGRFADALDASGPFAADFPHVTNPAWRPWRSLRAEALAGLGREDEAAALLEEELAAARRWGAPGTVGRTLRRLAALRRDEAALREAVDLLAASTARLEHARALLDLGTLVRLDRRPAEARDPLRAALELATACGATPVIDAARAELHASGARPRSAALSGPGSLTASERRVADLAAAGRTNRDIAQELYVTAKTVEVHLSSTYRKLGIRSRHELAGALAA